MKDVGCDELRVELDVTERVAEADADETEKRFDVVDVKSAEVRSQRYAHPQPTVVGDEAPLLADGGDAAEVALVEVAEYLEDDLVRNVIDRLL